MKEHSSPGTRSKKTVVLSLALLLSASAVIVFLILRTQEAGHVDDIRHQPAHFGNDTSRVWEFRTLARDFRSVNPDSTIHYATLGYDLAVALNFPSGQIWSLYERAVGYELNDEFEIAFSLHSEALSIAQEHQDRFSEARLYNGIGAAHYYSGNLTEAISHYSQAFSLSDSLGYDDVKSHALNNLGIIYRLQRRYDRALEAYGGSLELKRAQNDTTGIINSLYNMGLAFSYLNEYENSLTHLLEAKQLADDLTSQDLSVANIDIGIGVAYYNLANLTEARPYLETGINATEHRRGIEWVFGTIYLGGLDVAEGNFAQGSARIESAYQLAVSSGRLEVLRGVLKERAIAAGVIGNHTLAAESWRDYSILSDSLREESSRWAQEEMQARFELRDKEVTIARQDLELERETAQKMRFFVLGISLALLLLLSMIFMSYTWRQREKLKTEVSIKEHALNENDLLLQEMHHRIKNNLQLLNSLLSLQSQNATNQEARRALQVSRDTVGAIGLLHHQLYRSKDFRNVPLAPYVHDLSNYFNDAFSLKDRNIELDYMCDPIDVDIDRAIPLGLIINELVTNAIKHAFDGRDEGTIRLNLKQDEERITLEVADNGTGKHEHGSSSGTGKKLMKLFGDKLKAEFDYLNNDAGTLARFSFPLNA